MIQSCLHPLRLTADPSRVVVRPFHLAWQGSDGQSNRARRLVDSVLALDDRSIGRQLQDVMRDFEQRHWQTRKVFLKRFRQICALLDLSLEGVGDKRQQLIGAYFCHEYSYAAAALMNPSIVPHPDQTGLDRHTIRVLMSLRAVGEGHISSIAFREGLVSADSSFELAPQPPFATAADAPDLDGIYNDGPITVFRQEDSNISGTVIFPVTPAQSNGLEDLRLTHFTHDDGRQEYLGTYTAYSGRDIRSELMRTADFRSIEMVPMSGSAARNKGMALFPRKIGGTYRMIGRQDGQNLFLLESDDLTRWDEGVPLMTPKYPWEFIQIGNCGPPIEIDEGWLLLTHGVGAMRKYSIGAVLLDRDDPSKILGRTANPIIEAENEDRNGYVPNVVYTCGAMRVGDQLFMPYGISDSSVGFAFLPLKNLVNAMV
ncbi:glycoside hydrolase family 130 protein [Sphingomonas sp. LY29]|uniref:glycoside hydrolase family 130 protein n=1 Tax=unclassified Sphingomonas TaxID=196159 RepID=UPI002ADECC3F|nr:MULTISPECIES: glycoside hydrolase family 130 protein [unclassified Sphingomonas]MEA1072182.1 glycoside hydrolase family 130 protein [Sphingomonas sp. LY160]WRP25156.1 glycoside hydrolase family 130 protein [Sphingomonas sp. LY29]